MVIGVVTLCTGSAFAGGVFDNASYSATMSFDASTASLSHTSMNLTYDGTSYWSGAGGSSLGNNLAQWDSAGNWVATYSPGFDLRSVFTVDGSGGQVYAREFANATLYEMTSPGVFTPSVSLGDPFNGNSQVEFNTTGTEFFAHSEGTILRWDLAGNALPDVTLDGYSGSYPANVRAVAAGGYYLTNMNGNISAWNSSGDLVGTTFLIGAGSTFDTNFSLSWANDMLWLIDDDNGTWRGYDVGLSVPEPCAADLTGDGSLNFFDVSAFLTAFGNQDPVADFTGDGQFNFFDVSAFLTAFGDGCP